MSRSESSGSAPSPPAASVSSSSRSLGWLILAGSSLGCGGSGDVDDDFLAGPQLVAEDLGDLPVGGARTYPLRRRLAVLEHPDARAGAGAAAAAVAERRTRAAGSSAAGGRARRAGFARG